MIYPESMKAYFFPILALRSGMHCVGCMPTGLSTCRESSMIVVASGCTDKRGGADVVEVPAGAIPVVRSVVALKEMVLVREGARSSTGMGSA